MVPWSHENGEYYLKVNKAIQYPSNSLKEKTTHDLKQNKHF